MVLGTGALVIAKAGLGVDPGFWPLDIVAMLLGCLLGAFLPAFANEAKTIGGGRRTLLVSTLAWITMAMVFLAILFAGVPEKDYKKDWSFYTSVSLLGTATLGLLFLMLRVPYRSIIDDLRESYVRGVLNIK